MPTFISLFITLLLFAANSVLCRLALAQGYIDAGAFTILRCWFGLLALYCLLRWRRTHLAKSRGVHSASLGDQPALNTNYLDAPLSLRDCLPGLALFIYAASFSYAYLALDAGMGALILFALVQLTLFVITLLQKQQPQRVELVGIGIAFSGLVYLLWPDSGQVDSFGSHWAMILMALSGSAWGIYTWLGKRQTDALSATFNSFKVASLFCFALLPWVAWSVISWQGLMLAFASGAIASGMGYSIWYSLLPKLTAMQAGLYQLSVPILSAWLGVVFLAELLTMKFVLACALVLFGIALQQVFRSR